MRNKTQQPLVSVVMTAYNAAEFVGEAIASIQAQTYPNWELIVVNDGSTDNTGKILVDLAKNDQRIKMVHCRKNKGASVASNLGLSKARGSFIARMDSDDIALSDRLDKQINFLLNNPDVIVVGGQCELIDRDGVVIGIKNFPIKHLDIYDALYQYNPIQHPSLMINTKLLGTDKITYHTEVLLAHDLEILFKLAQFGRLANLSDIILKYRIHNDSLSLRDPKQTFSHTLAVRKMATITYGYVPSKKSILIQAMQKMIMFIVPSVVVYPLFRLIRMRRVLELKSKIAYVTSFVVAMIYR